LLLKNVELLERTIEGAVEVAFVTGKESEALIAIGKFLKHPGQAIFGSQLAEFVINILGAARQLVGEQAGFDGPNAAQPPAGDGHGLDQVHLDVVGGAELLDVGVEEDLELLAGFAGEQDGFGGETVAEAVAG
jgi:hypothetical protein